MSRATITVPFSFNGDQYRTSIVVDGGVLEDVVSTEVQESGGWRVIKNPSDELKRATGLAVTNHLKYADLPGAPECSRCRWVMRPVDRAKNEWACIGDSCPDFGKVVTGHVG